MRLDCLSGEFLVLGLGLEDDPGTWAGCVRTRPGCSQRSRPWTTGTEYLPMLDDRSDSRKAHPPSVYARLSALRRAVDPTGLFVGQHA